MTRSALPPGPGVPDVPESAVSELQALYREAAHAEPDALLDRKILDAARAELRGATGKKARPQPPWWKGWLPAASALAIALVGVSVTWRVMDQQESDLRREIKAADSVRERSAKEAGSAAPVQGAADAPPLPRAPAPPAEKKIHRTEATAAGDAPPGAPEAAAPPAPAAPAPMTPMTPMTPTVPAVTNEAVKKSGYAEREQLRERGDASGVADAVSGKARQAAKLEAGGPAIGSSGAAAADSPAGASAKPVEAKSSVGSVSLPPADAATPEAWLKHIRDLRASGQDAEAAQSLARFRARYPDFALPDELLKPK